MPEQPKSLKERAAALAEFAPSDAKDVFVFEPSRELCEHVANALVSSGHNVFAFSSPDELENKRYPGVADYIFFNLSFGEREYPKDSWTVWQFLNHVDVDADFAQIRLYYTTATPPTPEHMLSECFVKDSLDRANGAELFLGLPSSPVSRESLRGILRFLIVERFYYAFLLAAVIFALWWANSAVFGFILAVTMLSIFVGAESILSYLPSRYKRPGDNVVYSSADSVKRPSVS